MAPTGREVCVCACVRVCVLACVRVCVRASCVQVILAHQLSCAPSPPCPVSSRRRSEIGRGVAVSVLISVSPPRRRVCRSTTTTTCTHATARRLPLPAPDLSQCRARTPTRAHTHTHKHVGVGARGSQPASGGARLMVVRAPFAGRSRQGAGRRTGKPGLLRSLRASVRASSFSACAAARVSARLKACAHARALRWLPSAHAEGRRCARPRTDFGFRAASPFFPAPCAPPRLPAPPPLPLSARGPPRAGSMSSRGHIINFDMV